MSFRGRLALFFVLIVILPMVAAGVLVREVTIDSSQGKADARLAAGLETATSLYEEEVAKASALAGEMAADPGLGEALRDEDASAIEAAARGLADRSDVESLEIRGAGGDALATIGPMPQVAAGTVSLQDTDGTEIGFLSVATTSAEAYVEQVTRLTASDAVLTSGSEELAATAPPGSVVEPPAGDEAADAEVDGENARVAATDLPGDVRLALVGPVEAGGFFGSSPLVFAALGVFFAVAVLLVMAVVRSLQGQVGRMLDAARRIGGGDFSQKLPVSGRDELAGLADEFNKMSDRLSGQIDDLRSQRVEIERSVQRIGEAFASGLDRQPLLEIVAETAVAACSAQYGLIALSGHEGAEAAAGKATDALEEAALTAEDRAVRELELSTAENGDAHALGAPFRRIADPRGAVGAMTIARSERPFNEAERDVFLYLVGQASSSIENVALHEQVSEQAVTDDLTGLANKRALGDALEKEAARARRFSHDLSLLMLDIDDFKQVNDTYGHPQGDQVLRAVGRVLRAESRGVDEPARYGGEEFAVALPETDGRGAVELAERIRTRLELEQIPFLDRDGALKVTASIGVASIPETVTDIKKLVAAADAALYAAKRQGKNRVEQAPAAANGAAKESRGTSDPSDAEGEGGQASNVGDGGPAGKGSSPSPRAPTAG